LYLLQARSIQELARKKFEKLRINLERSQSEVKSEQKTKSNSLGKKPAKRPLGYASQEPVGSDFCSGVTLATTGEVLPISHPIQGIFCERPGNIDVPVEGNAFFFDVNQEKTEEFISGIPEETKLSIRSVTPCCHCFIFCILPT
jgi:bromodomain-containing protein 7/9